MRRCYPGEGNLVDRAERRFRAAMIEPRSGGMCRYCGHSVDRRHVGAWCADCQGAGQQCGAADLLETRRRERDSGWVTR